MSDEGNFCIHHGTHHCPHCAPPTIVEACEVIRGLLDKGHDCCGAGELREASRDFLKRVEGK